MIQYIPQELTDELFKLFDDHGLRTRIFQALTRAIDVDNRRFPERIFIYVERINHPTQPVTTVRIDGQVWQITAGHPEEDIRLSHAQAVYGNRRRPPYEQLRFYGTALYMVDSVYQRGEHFLHEVINP